MISIVLPTFNGEKYIEKAIIEILHQTYTDFELIIVNDCSTDSTPKIISQYAGKDDRIKVVNNISNQKLPRSLNIGFAQARGEFFTWTSDDNFYHKDALEKMISYLLENPAKDIVYAPYHYIDENDNLISYSEQIDGDVDKLYEGNVIGACFLYKREVHEKLNGYDVEQFLVEDYDFWLRALRHFNYGFIDECLYEYRLHENSLTSQKSSLIESGRILLQERELQLGVPSFEMQKKIIIMLIKYYYQVEDVQNMRKNILKLKQMCPSDFESMSISYKIANKFGIRIAKILGKIKETF